jgi:hypothetical protein
MRRKCDTPPLGFDEPIDPVLSLSNAPRRLQAYLLLAVVIAQKLEGIILTSRKEEFLVNTQNKQYFINFLGSTLAEYGCEVQHAMGDADLLIVQSTIE